MNKTTIFARLFLITAILLWLMPEKLPASQFSYVFPPNISIKITDTGVAEQDRFKLTATIESLLGTLSDLEVFFDSSKDLKIISNTRSLKSLAPKNLRKLKILAVKTGIAADELGSWVKIGVRYRPDYQAISAAINDTGKFPDRFERQKLVDVIEKNIKTGSRHLDAIRYFPQSAGN